MTQPQQQEVRLLRSADAPEHPPHLARRRSLVERHASEQKVFFFQNGMCLHPEKKNCFTCKHHGLLQLESPEKVENHFRNVKYHKNEVPLADFGDFSDTEEHNAAIALL